MDSKRISRRVAVKAAVSITSGDNKRIHGWISDISITGVHVQTDEVINTGTTCRVCLILREGSQRRRVFLEAKVVRQDAKGLALVFGHMDDDVHRDLSELLLNDLSIPT